ncbi:hypothetical protein [Pseudanabaena sp. Chao 1811]|uniref:hypothetical protein n=1 Tax=Pseudanabaena sp. Chao 1811 TaxID=2963092 RepID=UPI0022F38256|nr:hypothetical protein [Pseudanabaena sp. Chao 1811]
MNKPIFRGLWFFVVFWGVGVIVLGMSGFQLDSYKLGVLKVPLPHDYPLQDILTMIGVMSIEVLLFYVVIRPTTYRRSWGRALIALITAIFMVLLFGMVLMHSPPYMGWHWLWLVSVTFALFILFVVSTIQTLQLILSRKSDIED